MKSKFFVFAAVIAFGVLFGSYAMAGPLDDPCILHPSLCAARTDPSIEVHFTPPVLGVSFCETHPDVCDGLPPEHRPDLSDDDVDGVPAFTDNCPSVANADQANADGDEVGDACDNCPSVANDQADADVDGIGDVCEDDGDGGSDGSDASVFDFRPNSDDTDGDGDNLDQSTGHGCSLIGNSNSSGILSALLLAISLAPIGIRRRIK